MTTVTHILNAIEAGDTKAAAELLPLVYDELRQLAAVRMATENPGHTLQPTALVHEAYIRLVGPVEQSRWANRGHFFAAAAEAMRRILVDHARRRNTAKRGAGRPAFHNLELLPARDTDTDVIAIHEALERLATTEPKVAELVTLRYFGGLTVAEAAATLSVAPRTADAWWAYAKAWFATDFATS